MGGNLLCGEDLGSIVNIAEENRGLVANSIFLQTKRTLTTTAVSVTILGMPADCRQVLAGRRLCPPRMRE